MFIFFGGPQGFSQTIGDIIDPGINNQKLWSEQTNEIKGSPFLFDEWFSGEIKTKLGNTYPNMKIRYEAYSDQLYFLSEENLERVVAREKIDFFQFNDSKGFSYLFKHIPYHGFVQVLYENDILLYKKIKKEIKKAPESNGYNNTVKNDEFIKNEIYFIAPSRTEIIKSVEKKNQYLEIFSEYEKQLNQFIKKNKVKFKEDVKLIQLVQYTEGLVK